MNFQTQNSQPQSLEILGGKSNGTEILGKKFSKIWVYSVIPISRMLSFFNLRKPKAKSRFSSSVKRCYFSISPSFLNQFLFPLDV